MPIASMDSRGVSDVRGKGQAFVRSWWRCHGKSKERSRPHEPTETTSIALGTAARTSTYCSCSLQFAQNSDSKSITSEYESTEPLPASTAPQQISNISDSAALSLLLHELFFDIERHPLRLPRDRVAGT